MGSGVLSSGSGVLGLGSGSWLWCLGSWLWGLGLFWCSGVWVSGFFGSGVSDSRGLGSVSGAWGLTSRVFGLVSGVLETCVWGYGL